MLAIMKKELKSYFLSPIGYVTIGIFLIICSIFFYITSIDYGVVDLTNLFYCVALYGLMFMTPLITMWSISGERKSGTEQLIITSPVSILGVVIAKFLSAFIITIIEVLFTLMYFGILSIYQVPDIPTYITSIIGFLLLSMTYLSFGMLASSITESPVISGIVTLGLIFASTWLPEIVTSLSDFSLLNIFINFLYGQIDIVSTVFFISLTVLCLTITVIVMQRRRI